MVLYYIISQTIHIKINKYPIRLRFIESQSFVSRNTLRQFGIDFGDIDNSIRGIFSYEVINDKNYNEALSKNESFEYDSIYSYLNQKNPLTK